MDEDPLAFLEVIASQSRRKILALLAKGIDHPEELAKRMKLRRQGVDKHLLQLYEWGLVDRSAILPAGGRPRIVYRLSSRGQDFLARAETIVRDYEDAVRGEHQASLRGLEDKLAAGELDEDAYLKRRQEIERRYARFGGGGSK